jgi:hypothetical protein
MTEEIKRYSMKTSSQLTTQRYSKVSNLKVERDYHKAMEVVMQRSSGDLSGL